MPCKAVASAIVHHQEAGAYSSFQICGARGSLKLGHTVECELQNACLAA